MLSVYLKKINKKSWKFLNLVNIRKRNLAKVFCYFYKNLSHKIVQFHDNPFVKFHKLYFFFTHTTFNYSFKHFH